MPATTLTEDTFEEGIGFDGSSIRGFQKINESDMLLIPDADTAFMDPFTDVATLNIICDVEDPITRERYSRDPRNVAKKAQNYLKSTGVADVTTCEPLRADSPFQIGSNTKMMTAAMIYQLQEEGKLSTSDLLSKWLPDLAAKLPNGDKMTIEMMLTHTTGMKDYFDVPGKDGSIADGAKNTAILTRAFTPEELVKITADSGLSEFAPAAEGQWKYNNTGYILLGLIIEKATGKSYEENLKTRIFEPLGLKQTYLQTGEPKAGALPQAYYKSPFDFSTGEWNASQGWSAPARSYRRPMNSQRS
jgi:CubicO group peptidase (beta-lactamase class C family)